MLTHDDYLSAGREAAHAFGLAVADITVLSESENVVLDATLDSGEHVVLRLHRSGYNTVAELKSEVAFVDSLRHFGVPVPTALPAANGGYYVPVTVGEEQRQVGAVQWVDGQPLGGPLDGDQADVVPHYTRIGQLAAQVRLHNTAWAAPDGFVRRRWDAEGLVGNDPLWGRFWEVEALTADQSALLGQARERLFAELSALSVGPDRFGLIHSDLHLGNLMVHDDELTIIDFDDAGYGWFSHELAVALHPLLGEPTLAPARRALVAGYREHVVLEEDEERLIDTFLTVRSLMIVGWLAGRPELPVYDRLGDVIVGAVHAAEQYLAADK